MNIYLASYAYVADIEAENDDRDPIEIEQAATPQVAYVWTEAAYPAGLTKAMAEIIDDYRESYMEPEPNTNVLRWEANDKGDYFQLFDDEHDTPVGLFIVECREVQ